uniref:SH2 domain-containing protein 1B n=1 Tax=Centroberyx gerrardi TaxID=166262 RepID=UPI003AAE81E0
MAAALPVSYHGAISKQECEQLLGKKDKDGAYLIRDSETIQGAMCLCVYKQHMVYTYRLLQTRTGHYTMQAATGVGEKCFKTLEELIRHYKRKNQGLAMHLRHSVKRKTALLIRPLRAAEEEPEYENVDGEPPDYVDVLPS